METGWALKCGQRDALRQTQIHISSRHRSRRKRNPSASSPAGGPVGRGQKRSRVDRLRQSQSRQDHDGTVRSRFDGHLTGELFKITAGVDFVHVPYRGAGPALSDLLAGQVATSFAGIAGSIEYIRTARLRALAVSTATCSRRANSASSLPTKRRSGARWFARPTSGWNRHPAEQLICSRLKPLRDFHGWHNETPTKTIPVVVPWRWCISSRFADSHG